MSKPRRGKHNGLTFIGYGKKSITTSRYKMCFVIDKNLNNLTSEMLISDSESGLAWEVRKVFWRVLMALYGYVGKGEGFRVRFNGVFEVLGEKVIEMRRWWDLHREWKWQSEVERIIILDLLVLNGIDWDEKWSWCGDKYREFFKLLGYKIVL